MADTQLSAVEAELYDRQIRLWGIESQEKLRAANILLINIRGLGSEIAKDILLSGINSLNILDDGIVTKEECANNFLLLQDFVGQQIAEAVITKAQALNPLVKLNADTESLDQKKPDYFAKFTIVIATGLSNKQILKVSSSCKKYNVKYICGDNFGMFGYAIADFHQHNFYEDRVLYAKKRTHTGTTINQEKTTIKVASTLSYPDLSEVITISKQPQKVKRRNVYYYLMLALLEFRNTYLRRPMTVTKVEDIAALKKIKSNILSIYQVSAAKLPDCTLELLFDEVVPICSIIGGVISQEVIKAISCKEVPIHNVFLLDPYNYNGREESVGDNIQPVYETKT